MKKIDTERINEADWAEYIVEVINSKLIELFPNRKLCAEKEKSLMYAYEINEYGTDGNHEARTMGFKTDILIFENLINNRWKPRVVIETKIRGVTTHDAITYSKKAASHKAVHPYIRYGIFVGEIEHIPKRLMRHGENFDFMISWAKGKPTPKELDDFTNVIRREVEASIQMDHIYGRQEIGKESKKYTLLHRPLVLATRDDTNSGTDSRVLVGPLP